MGVSCIHLAAAFASLMFILFLSYGETTGGGVPSDAVTAHQEGYGAKEPEGEEKKDVESPELAATELAEEEPDKLLLLPKCHAMGARAFGLSL